MVPTLQKRAAPTIRKVSGGEDGGYEGDMTVHDPLGPQPDPPDQPIPAPGGPVPPTPLVPDPAPTPDPTPADPPHPVPDSDF